jgi:hypothetical protein
MNQEMKGMTAFVVPGGPAKAGLREALEAHLLGSVLDHNQGVMDKLHYLRTGEMLTEAVRQWAPFVSKPKEPWVERTFKAQLIVLAEVIPTLQGAKADDTVTSLTDAQLIELYGRVLLRLSSIHNPVDGDR